MAPYTFDSSVVATLVTVALGVAFGFIIERGGLGNARKLAAQFYFTDLRVLKVMFTAIVVAMVLLYLAGGTLALDLHKIWINPTYLWPGIIGGLLLGVGFIIGGYCPGTSLVAAATGKLDGLAYLGGIILGMWVFGETVPSYWEAWHNWSSLGRVTLQSWLGVGAGVVVVGVVLMALGMFWGANLIEAKMGELPAPSLRARRLQQVGAGALLAGALVVAAVGQPTVDDFVEARSAELEETLASRDVHLDPGEVLDLTHNRGVRLQVVDVRGDHDYNIFHLLDSQRLPAEAELMDWARSLPAGQVTVLASNDEALAEDAWKKLTALGALNVYVLEGGINGWLDIYGQDEATPIFEDRPGDLRYRFAAALGSGHPSSRPGPPGVDGVPERHYHPKVKVQKASGGGGGCG